MNPTSTVDFSNHIVGMFKNALEQGTLRAYRIIWEAVRNFIFQNWAIILVVVFTLFSIAIGKFLIFGRWGMLGSLLYRVVYLVGLFVVTLVFGPDIFTSIWIKLALMIFGVVCFEMVGYFLRKFGVHTYR